MIRIPPDLAGAATSTPTRRDALWQETTPDLAPAPPGARDVNIVYGDARILRDPDDRDWVYGESQIIVGLDGAENRLYGEAYSMIGAWGADDTLVGGDGGVNYLYGEASDMEYSRSGDDLLVGGESSVNYMYGDAQGVIYSAMGNDTLIAGDGGLNYMYGDADVMLGTEYRAGEDRLVSGTGEDHMWGDFAYRPPYLTPSLPLVVASDTFVFREDSGHDTIYDFDKGLDVIEVDRDGTFTLPASSRAFERMSEVARQKFVDPYGFEDLVFEEIWHEEYGDGTLIWFDDMNSVTVHGVSGLTEDNFIFV